MLEYEKFYHRLCNLSLAANVFIVGNKFAVEHIKEKRMGSHLKYEKAAPGALRAMYSLQKYVDECGLEKQLIELVKTRASQINGCAYCIDMHTKDARAVGDTEQRLYELDAWRETPFYSEKERAALAWTEAITEVWETQMPDAAFEEVKKQFSEKEIVDLTIATGMINLWNRVAISLRAVPGHYRAAAVKA